MNDRCIRCVFVCAWALAAGETRAGPHLALDAGTTFSVALEADSPVGQASIREHAITWHPVKKKYYLIADVIPLTNSNHPNTYDTELYLWSSPDLATWRFLGLAIPKGKPGVTYDGTGVASPADMAYLNGKLYVPFSARKTPRFDKRGIGLAWSGPDPEILPWTKTPSPISDLPGEDDDPAVVVIPGDNRLHLYHRTTGPGGGYRIVYTASTRPEDPSSWPAAKNVTVRPEGVRAQEWTGAICVNDMVHLFVIEQGTAVRGIQIAHLCSPNPGAVFKQAHATERYLIDQPERLKSGGHFTPVVRDGKLVVGFWTVVQSGQRYGLAGHPIRFRPTKRPTR